MRFEIDSNESTSLFHNSPGSRIGDWEDPLIRSNSLIPDIVFESVSEPLGDKDELLLHTTLWFFEGQSPVIDI